MALGNSWSINSLMAVSVASASAYRANNPVPYLHQHSCLKRSPSAFFPPLSSPEYLFAGGTTGTSLARSSEPCGEQE